ncbi:hypothetical protein BDB01DRAFT_413539 [Pilobolus umbonatus]|nr:hypothetical protein BDB01DRAFT_413539 [Pilobolus umbonatus]
MSSLTSLINNIKANTATNPLVQKAAKRKADKSEELAQKRKRIAQANRQSGKKKNGPDVVVFDSSVLEKKPVLEDKASKKRFLDSRIVIHEDTNTNVTKEKSSKSDLEEAENLKHDMELKQLLATSNLLEELERDEMTSKERRRHTMNKLEKLGIKNTKKDKLPIPLALNMKAVHKERALKKLQEAKDLGIYDKSTRHLYVDTKPKKRDRDPGIVNGIGRLKGATLVLNKSEIDRIKRQGTKKMTKGKKRK